MCREYFTQFPLRHEKFLSKNHHWVQGKNKKPGYFNLKTKQHCCTKTILIFSHVCNISTETYKISYNFLEKVFCHDLSKPTQPQIFPLHFTRKKIWKIHISNWNAVWKVLSHKWLICWQFAKKGSIYPPSGRANICQDNRVSMQGGRRLSGHQVLNSNWHFKWNPRAVSIKGSLNWSNWKAKGTNKIAGCLLSGSSVCLFLFLLIDTVTTKHFQYWLCVILLH